MNKIIWILRFLMTISFVFLFFILLFSSPYKNNIPGNKELFNILLFFFFFFTSFFSFFSLFFYRFRKNKQEKKNDHLRNQIRVKLLEISLRHGFLLSCGLILLLIFQSYRILTWWIALLAGGAILLIELYFLSEKE